MVNGKWYHGSNVTRAHQNARLYCSKQNLELASVATEEDYDNVQFFIGDKDKKCNVIYFF